MTSGKVRFSGLDPFSTLDKSSVLRTKKYLRSLFQFLFRRGPEIAYIVDVSFPRGGKWEILGEAQKGQNFTLGHSESESLGGGERKETRKKYGSTIS